MNYGVRQTPVPAGQKVAQNQREAAAKKPFTVNWNRTSATIGQTVGITGTINITISNPAQISVGILHDGKPFGAAENVVVKGDQITAQWKVKPFKVGNFKDGAYDVEIRYNGSLPGKTSVSLKIVDAVQGGDFFG